MSTDPLVGTVAAIVDASAEPDDTIRETLAAIVLDQRVRFAQIFFAESGALVPGPSAGEPAGDGARAPIVFNGADVGELRVTGDVPADVLAALAETLAATVLLGWDTGGEPWVP
ncbi:MAG: hypothetical protein ACKVUT_01605 [Gaiella sp.]